MSVFEKRSEAFSICLVLFTISCPRANGAKRRSGCKPGARVTNSVRLFTPGEKDSIADSKVGVIVRMCGHLTDLKNMDVYQEWKRQKLPKTHVRKLKNCFTHYDAKHLF